MDYFDKRKVFVEELKSFMKKQNNELLNFLSDCKYTYGLYKSKNKKGWEVHILKNDIQVLFYTRDKTIYNYVKKQAIKKGYNSLVDVIRHTDYYHVGFNLPYSIEENNWDFIKKEIVESLLKLEKVLGLGSNIIELNEKAEKKVTHYIFILSEGVYDENYGRRHNLLDIKAGKGNIKQRLSECKRWGHPNAYPYRYWEHYKNIESTVHKMLEERGKRLADKGAVGGESFRIFRDDLESVCNILDSIFDKTIDVHEKDEIVYIGNEKVWKQPDNRNSMFDFINDLRNINKDLVVSLDHKGNGLWSWFFSVKLNNRIIVERIYPLKEGNFSVLLPKGKTKRISCDEEYNDMLENSRGVINYKK